MTQFGGGPVRPARKVGGGFLCLIMLLAVTVGLSAVDLKKKFDPVVKEVAARHRLDPELIHAVIKAESNYDPFAVSVKGALGLMQLMPDTARHYGVLNVFDAAQNIEGGVKYIKDLIKLYNGKTHLVLAAYNAGQEAVRQYGGIPPYRETRDYIARIRSTYKSGFIRVGTKIYKYYDDNGRLVLTNDENLAKAKNQAVTKSPSER